MGLTPSSSSVLTCSTRGSSSWRVLLVPTRAFATAAFFWLALLPPGLAKAALPGNVTLWHYHLDHLGTPHSITDASGNLYRQTRITAYGEVRGRYDGSGNVVATEVALRHEFTGYQNEEKSGLQYAGARYYLSELGVFTSHDPAGQFPSPYAYGPGDPINGTDPNGSFFSLFRALFKAIVSFFKTLFKTGDVVEALGAAGIDFVSSVANYAVASVAQNEQLGAFVGGAVRAALQHAVQGYSTAPEKEGSKGAQRAARLGRDLVDAAFGREKTDSGRSRHQVVSRRAGSSLVVLQQITAPQYVHQHAPWELIGTRDYYIWRYLNSPDEFWHGEGPNYYIEYGLRMFDEFQILRRDASRELKQFIDITAVELQVQLERTLSRKPSIGYDRNDLKEAAFDTHSIAYNRGGFFDLPITDQFRVVRTIGSELFDRRTIREAFEALEGR